MKPNIYKEQIFLIEQVPLLFFLFLLCT